MAGSTRFVTTHWSVVTAAADPTSPRSRDALATLCRTYWYPLYAFARRKGAGPEAAQDQTQEFFARLLERDSLRQVSREKGRFRAFLLVSFKNFLVDEAIRARAQKRGGGQTPVSIDLQTAEGRYSREPSDERTPDRIFERRWAMTLLGRVLKRLREEYVEAGREDRFERLEGYLTGESDAIPYAEVAEQLGLNAVSVKVAVHRLRRRYRSLLLEEIAQTVSSQEDVDAEIRHLFSALDADGGA